MVAPHEAGRPGSAEITVSPRPNGEVTLVNNSDEAATVTADIVGYLPS
jgi:hypothetical protein